MQHSFQNMVRTKKVVLNMPDDSPEMVAAINRLARTTGTPQPNEWKLAAGYKHVFDKWTHSGLTPQKSVVEGMPARIRECPVQMEAEVIATHPLMEELGGAVHSIEVKILKVHVRPDMLLTGHANRVDPDKVKPVFVVFQEFYGMAPGRLGKSRLADIQEELYRGLTGTEADGAESVSVKDRVGKDENGEMDGSGYDLARGISNNQ